MKNKLNRLLSSILCTLSILSLSSCAKDTNCNIDIKHYHIYKNEETGYSRFSKGEKEYITSLEGTLYKTDAYAYIDDYTSMLYKNNLSYVFDNKDYLRSKMTYIDEREEYKLVSKYGYHYSYEYDYNPATEEYEFFYGNHYGYYEEYDWVEISPYEYTYNKVRDIHYTYKFYKYEDGKLISKTFDKLEDVPSEYNLFNSSSLIVKEKSDDYYLTPENTKTIKNN